MEGGIRLVGAAPSPLIARALLQQFAKGGQGHVTAFNDGIIPSLVETTDADAEKFLNLTVVTFTKLVSEASDLTNSPPAQIASSGLMATAMGAACRALPAENPLSRVGRFPGFHRALLRTLAELHEHRYDAPALREAANALLDRGLGSKLRAMADLDERVAEMLQDLGRSTLTRRIGAILGEEPDSDEVVPRLLVFGGGEFSPAKLDLLRWFTSHGTEVTLVMDAAANDARLFGALERTEEELGMRAERMAVSNRLLANLFAPSPGHGPELSDGVLIESAGDELAECEWALRHIAAEPDVPTVLVVRQMEAYAPLLEVTARRLGVPVRVHRSEPLLSNGLARTFLCMLESLDAPHPRDLANVLECRYFDLPPSVRARLKSLVDAKWEEAQLPPGIADATEEGFDWLSALLEIRASKSEPLSFAGWSEQVLALLAAESWAIPSEGARGRENRDANALSAMRRRIFDRVAVDRDDLRALDLSQYVAELKAMFADADVYVPAPQGATPVVSDPGAILGADRVIVLGLLEGVFPKRRKEDPVLGDEERAMLSGALSHLPALPDSAASAAAERDLFYRLCGLAERRLVLTYPRAQGDRDNVKAFYLEAVKAAHPVSALDHPRGELVPPVGTRVAECDLRLGERLDAVPDLWLDERIIGDLAMEAARDAARTATLNDVLRLRECPFRFVMRHKFALYGPRGGESAEALLPRLALEAQLLAQPTPEAAREALFSVLDEALQERERRLSPWELRALRTRADAYILDAVSREFASRERWRSGDLPPVSGDAPGRQDGIAQAVGLELDLDPAGVGETGGVPVLYYFQESTPRPNTMSESQDVVRQREAAEFREILLWGAQSAWKDPLIVEIDAATGSRTRLCFNLPTGMSQRSGDGATVHHIRERDDEDKRPRREKLKAFAGALKAVREGGIFTNPGPYCARCEYADLCRNAQEDREAAAAAEALRLGPL